MMTRGDFEVLAYEIKWRSTSLEEAHRTVEIIREALRQSSRLTVSGNRAFDYDKFLAAATERWTHG